MSSSDAGAGAGAGAGAEFPIFRRLTFYAVLAGLCPLIPIPFVDDWTLRQVRHRMLGEIDEHAGLALAPGEARCLLGEEGRRPGCLSAVGWVARSVVLRLVRKLLRTVLYVLAVRQGVHRATETFHEGYLLLRAARAGVLAGPRRPPERAAEVRRAVEATLAQMDVKPVRRAVARAFRGSFFLLARASRRLARLLRRGSAASAPAASAASFEEEERRLTGVTDRLAASLWGNRDYFQRLEGLFARHLRRYADGPSPSGDAPSSPAADGGLAPPS